MDFKKSLDASSRIIREEDETMNLLSERQGHVQYSVMEAAMHSEPFYSRVEVGEEWCGD
jgi:hypothetical protein